MVELRRQQLRRMPGRRRLFERRNQYGRLSHHDSRNALSYSSESSRLVLRISDRTRTIHAAMPSILGAMAYPFLCAYRCHGHHGCGLRMLTLTLLSVLLPQRDLRPHLDTHSCSWVFKRMRVAFYTMRRNHVYESPLSDLQHGRTSCELTL
jgi:hypothetical protein